MEYAKETLGFSGAEIPIHDLNAVTVPGAAAAWVDTIEKLGSGKLTMEEILSPAIDLAENGYKSLCYFIISFMDKALTVSYQDFLYHTFLQRP